jgi:hypothetical protein
MLTAESYRRDLSPEHQVALTKTVTKGVEVAEKVHNAYLSRWKEAYQLHRNHTAIKEYVRTARDQDAALRDAENYWKSQLFIPLVFSAIESIVPRALSNNPTMTVRPTKPEAAAKCKRVKETLEQQQRNISYDLKLQPTARRGFKYGLGVQKTYWETKKRRIVKREPRRILRGDKAVQAEIIAFQGPQVEDVEIADFFWDPAAKDVESARWLIHRTWRDTHYIKSRMEQGDWFVGGDGNPLSPDAITEHLKMIGDAGSGSYTAANAWGDRLDSLGISGQDTRAGRDHEILEYHDRERVYVVINRQFVAVCDITPFWHQEMPFQIFRPTLQEGEFVGISEIEPIKHLAHEINTVRGLRLDNAKFVVNRVTAYMEGMVDPETLKRGPGALIPTIANPNEILFQLPVEDLPASSYRETEEIKSDFDRATGIDDSTAGAGAAGDTATGIQLVQGAANVRIAQKTKNMMAELIRPASRQWCELNRQHLPRDEQVRIDTEDGGYRFENVDPEDFADVDVAPDAGSTEPENRVQKVNDALTVFNQLVQNPQIDQRKLVTYLLEQNEIPDPESFLAPEAPNVGDALMLVAEQLREGGMPDDEITAFMEPLAAQLAPPEAAQEQGGQPADQPAAQAA